jgi:large subunit ribosomal protein L22
MEVKASLKYLRISPRKVRLVVDLIRGLPVKNAEAYLLHLSKKSSHPLLKLLRSAMANAEHNFNLDKNNLYVRAMRVDEGPALKRWRARARGAAYPIRKRSSHIFLTLEEIKEKKKGIRKVKESKKISEAGKEEEKKEKKKEKSLAYTKKQESIKRGKGLKRLPQKQKIFRRKSM